MRQFLSHEEDFVVLNKEFILIAEEKKEQVLVGRNIFFYFCKIFSAIVSIRRRSGAKLIKKS